MNDDEAVLRLQGSDGQWQDFVVLGMVEDKGGALAVACPLAALQGSETEVLPLRVLRVRERSGRMEVEDETDPERAAWAVSVTEETFLNDA